MGILPEKCIKGETLLFWAAICKTLSLFELTAVMLAPYSYKSLIKSICPLKDAYKMGVNPSIFC